VKQSFIINLTLVLICLFLFIGCGDDGNTTTNITSTPTPVNYSLSGKIYTSAITQNTPAGGVTIRIYKVDSEALRSPSPAYTGTSGSDGYWGPFQAEPDTYYEIELSKTGYTPVYHLYLPPVTGNRSDANLEYNGTDNLTYVSGGFISITRDTSAKKIVSTDIIKLNDSPNLNSSIVSPGTLSFLKIYRSGAGDSSGNKDYYVSADDGPGTFYSVTYNQSIRAIRVFPCSLNHRTGVIFY